MLIFHASYQYILVYILTFQVTNDGALESEPEILTYLYY